MMKLSCVVLLMLVFSVLTVSKRSKHRRRPKYNGLPDIDEVVDLIAENLRSVHNFDESNKVSIVSEEIGRSPHTNARIELQDGVVTGLSKFYRDKPTLVTSDEDNIFTFEMSFKFERLDISYNYTIYRIQDQSKEEGTVTGTCMDDASMTIAPGYDDTYIRFDLGEFKVEPIREINISSINYPAEVKQMLKRSLKKTIRKVFRPPLYDLIHTMNKLL